MWEISAAGQWIEVAVQTVGIKEDGGGGTGGGGGDGGLCRQCAVAEACVGAE